MSYFQYEETKMYYEEVGEGVPFLLIHGWAIDHRFLMNCLEPVFGDCSKQFRRIYIDIPGMGLSKKGSVKNGDGIVRVIEAFMETNYKDQRFVVGGNSFGTALGRALAARNTDKIIGMMLIAPSVDGANEGSKEGPEYIDEEFAATLSKQEVEDYLLMHAVLTKETYDRYLRLVKPSVDINLTNGFSECGLRGSFSFDITKMLVKKHFNAPIFILTGKNDRAVGYEKQYKWMELFNNVSYMVISGAGHNIQVDKPEMFHSCIKAWIEEYL